MTDLPSLAPLACATPRASARSAHRPRAPRLPRIASPGAAAAAAHTPPTQAALSRCLRQVFGLKRLRPGQAEVIQRVLAGQSTLAVMPTGAGKSLCYQLPAALSPRLTLVISPLIALMKDQCDAMNACGVAALQLHSGVDAAGQAEGEQALQEGRAQVLFTTPERAAEPPFRALLQTLGIGLLVVDEAHCIAQWGHDFRPAFAELGELRQALQGVPTLALTATASDEVEDEICAALEIPADGVLRTGIYRPNLDYRVEMLDAEATRLRRVRELVRDSPGAGIVYASTVRMAEQLHALLSAPEPGEAAGSALRPPPAVALYHGQMGAAERIRQQDDFMQGRARVMVATPAFGMGIDKADIRFVVHAQLTPSLDAYYQESGRAGRDGRPARCTLLFLRGDRALQRFFLMGRYPSRNDVRALWQMLLQQAPRGGWLPHSLREAVDAPLSRTRQMLSALRQLRLVRLGGQGRLMADPRHAASQVVDQLASAYDARKVQDRARLAQMLAYAQSGSCRWQRLLAHFGQSLQSQASRPGPGSRSHPAPPRHCGHCDSCLRLAALAGEAPPEAPQVAPARAALPQAGLAVGAQVEVRRHGCGQVVALAGEVVSIRFPGQRRPREFHADFVQPALPG